MAWAFIFVGFIYMSMYLGFVRLIAVLMIRKKSLRRGLLFASLASIIPNFYWYVFTQSIWPILFLFSAFFCFVWLIFSRNKDAGIADKHPHL